MTEQKATNITWHEHNVTTEEIEKLHGHKGATIWFTGLSASGKSTIANAVAALLHEMKVSTFVLDGDNIRHGLNKNLGFSAADREENIRRIGEVAKLTGVKPYVLRYWESEFSFMAPQKSKSKQRLYRRRDIDMILLIKKLLYEQRYTIAGARKQLRELGAERVREESRARYKLGEAASSGAQPEARPETRAAESARAVPWAKSEAKSDAKGDALGGVLSELRALRTLLAADL